ncbi:UNVERIFIED_CONTAM: hypothetical protein NCL1_47643 [Trichonephila clavipes]
MSRGQRDWSRLQDHMATTFDRSHSSLFLVMGLFEITLSTFTELQDSICLDVSTIHSDMFPSAVTGVVKHLNCYKVPGKAHHHKYRKH